MKNRFIVALIILSLLIVVILLDLMGTLYPLNPIVNSIIGGEAPVNCKFDSECMIAQIGCPGDCNLQAVNKNWQPFCIFNNYNLYQICKNETLIARCINNQCQTKEFKE